MDGCNGTDGEKGAPGPGGALGDEVKAPNIIYLNISLFKINVETRLSK